MTIIHRKCKLCDRVIRENGDFQFRAAVQKHFQKNHRPDYAKWNAKAKELTKKVKELQDEAGDELILSFGGHFSVDKYGITSEV